MTHIYRSHYRGDGNPTHVIMHGEAYYEVTDEELAWVNEGDDPAEFGAKVYEWEFDVD